MNFHNWILCYRELCYHDSLLSWQQKKKIYQWICNIQIICKLYYANLLRIIVFEFFEHWTMLIVFLFLVLISWKFYSWITKKHDQTFIFVEKPSSLCKGSYRISPVHLSICLSVCLQPSVIHFSQDLVNGFS